MDKALKLIVSLLAAVMGLAFFMAALLALFITIGFIIGHFLAVINVVLGALVVAGVWKLAYDLLFGDH